MTSFIRQRMIHKINKVTASALGHIHHHLLKDQGHHVKAIRIQRRNEVFRKSQKFEASFDVYKLFEKKDDINNNLLLDETIDILIRNFECDEDIKSIYSTRCLYPSKIANNNYHHQPNEQHALNQRSIHSKSHHQKDISTSSHLFFDLNQHSFLRRFFDSIIEKHSTSRCANNDIEEGRLRRRVIVEFSSPNIAKPFHVGHLRSTIVGNFVANALTYLGHEVIKINFLGDWGTQFGLLAAEIRRRRLTSFSDVKLHGESEGKSRVIETLSSLYVDANKRSKVDLEFAAEARRLFTALENGDPELLKFWEEVRQHSLGELENIYEELGIQFDYFQHESDFGGEFTKNYLRKISKSTHSESVENSQHPHTVKVKNEDEMREVKLLKSDGSTLYISRDIVGALERQKQFKFDEMIYVVENGQSKHFQELFAILKNIDSESCWTEHLKHVKFGHIEGMSSRSGGAVMLNNVLQEASSRIKQQRLESNNTRSFDETSLKALSISAVFINDLRYKRGKPYKFDWHSALQSTGDSGIKMQYTHSRLYSLLTLHGLHTSTETAFIDTDAIVSLLLSIKTPLDQIFVEKESLTLIEHMLNFDDTVEDACHQLEASLLVSYIFKLCNFISKSLKSLRIKDLQLPENDDRDVQDVKNGRLVLFACSQILLRRGMFICGLPILNEM